MPAVQYSFRTNFLVFPCNPLASPEMLLFFFYLSLGVHMQVCYTGKLVSWGFVVQIISLPRYYAQNPIIIFSTPLPPPTLHPQVGLSVCCFLVFTDSFHLVPLISENMQYLIFCSCVSFLWWWPPAPSMLLQKTWPHSFLWLHSIPWCICTTFSLFDLSLMSL